MSYVVLARKWRPMTFTDLVGQGHVAATLGNAIKTGRVAHAFLFTGVRGVGKTTSARIMAKALNCLSSDGPTATPCLTCSACREITEGTDMDVQEIDGASYTGVDDVRRLQESMPYRPTRDRYKVFIVDEVHMLSTAAWNAFLKTLEEPPPHVKFIFATTEVHKVPVTILSRVQRFDFKLIPTRLILERLAFVLKEEGIRAEEAALAIIAREAAGSMRDAMSLLDQVIAWSDQDLSESAVTQVLGVASRKVLYELVQELIAGRPGPVLSIVDALANQGFDIAHVAKDLLAVLRDVVVSASADDPDQLLELPDEERASVRALAQHSLDDLLRLHQGFSHGFDEVVRSSQPRAGLEMLLVRLARRPPLVPIDDLIERLIKLEKRLHGAPKPSGGAPRGGPPPRLPPNTPPTPRADPSRAAPAQPEPPRAEPRLAEPPKAAPVEAQPPKAATTSEPPKAESPLAPPALTPPVKAEPPRAELPKFEPAPAPTAPAPAERRAEPPTPPIAREPITAGDSMALESWQAAEPLERWRLVLDRVRAEDPKLAAFLEHAEIQRIDPTELSIRYERGGFLESCLAEPDATRRIRSAALALFGSEPQFSAEAVDTPASGLSVFTVDKQARLDEERAAVEQARQHPMLLEAVRVLGARVKTIELPKS